MGGYETLNKQLAWAGRNFENSLKFINKTLIVENRTITHVFRRKTFMSHFRHTSSNLRNSEFQHTTLCNSSLMSFKTENRMTLEVCQIYLNIVCLEIMELTSQFGLLQQKNI